MTLTVRFSLKVVSFVSTCPINFVKLVDGTNVLFQVEVFKNIILKS